jgi:hypothetical protein
MREYYIRSRCRNADDEATLHSPRDHQEAERVQEGIGGQVVIGQTLLVVKLLMTMREKGKSQLMRDETW